LAVIKKIIIMKKLLLFGALFTGSIFTANAQYECIDAINITGTSTHVVGDLEGEVPTGTTAQVCFAAYTTSNDGSPATAMWYKFTAPASGLMTIDSGIAANPIADTDTRLRVMTGTCGTFTCVASSDDISDDDYRSRISNFIVTAGTTYYIVWDNRWLSTGFTFNFTFTAQSCFAPTNFEYAGAPTTTSATITWTAPAGGSPIGYQVEYGPYGYTQGTGTVVTTATTQVQLALTPSTAYQFYIRTNCGATDGFSNWVGPIAFNSLYEPTSLPYAMGFENGVDPEMLGWLTTPGPSGTDWTLGTTTATRPAQEGTQYAQAGANGGVSNAWLFSRPINMTAGVPVTVTYYMRKAALAGAGNVNNLTVTWGTAATAAAQTNILATYTDYQSTTYEQKTHTFTPTTTGTHVIAFNYTAPAHVQANFGVILLDNVNVTATAGTNNNFLAAQLSIYPNPATNVINVSNADNILVSGIEIVDLNGRTVKTAKFDGVTEAQINISDLSAGMYMMTVSSDQGTLTKKIVKQ
jgi:hypothetical protein